jgi:hypothetical protein
MEPVDEGLGANKAADSLKEGALHAHLQCRGGLVGGASDS